MFCLHEYLKMGFSIAEDSNERYSIREYECIHCGKIKKVDGRRDYIGGLNSRYAVKSKKFFGLKQKKCVEP